MKKIGVIQEFLGKLLLPLRVKKNDRKPKVFTYDNAKEIGILYNVTDKDTHQQIANYAAFITKAHKEISVNMLGYMDFTELEQCLTNTVPTSFFSPLDFSWNGKLRPGAALDFAKKKYDILIDMTTETSFPTLYIEKLSCASYKVGRYIENDMRYDLMIDTKNDNTISCLITQINVYLTKIKVKQ
ncbi:MAG: hypothetical protein MJ197_00355 [Bacteroidales bacterium]|nr:hypothetical protein [Bacteroidales bacterium]